MNRLLLAIASLAALVASPALAGNVQTVCTPHPTVCTAFVLEPDDRFDPFVQHLLIREQLQAVPQDVVISTFGLPAGIEKRHLEELQIQFLDQLQQRRAAEESTEK